jgi:hypothetical protein
MTKEEKKEQIKILVSFMRHCSSDAGYRMYDAQMQELINTKTEEYEDNDD